MVNFIRLLGAAIVGRKTDFQRTFALSHEIGGAVLIPEGMTTDADRLGPIRYQARHVVADDGFAEHGAIEDVTNRAVGRFIQGFQTKLRNPRFVRGNGGAFYTDAMPFDGMGSLYRHLILGGVAMFDAQIVIVDGQIQIRQNQLILDIEPNDASHFVAIEFHHRLFDLYLVHTRS